MYTDFVDPGSGEVKFHTFVIYWSPEDGCFSFKLRLVKFGVYDF